jgi:hypothetical protein
LRALLADALRERVDPALVMLTGSWAYHEPHLPPRRSGWIESLSDVDLIYTDAAPPELLGDIRLAVEATLSGAGVHARAVSFRRRSEMATLPHAAAWTTGRLDRGADPSAFLLFWSAVQAMEWCATVGVPPGRRAARPYAAAKFLFALLRNLALLRGDVLASYASVTEWLAGEHSMDAGCAYRIKLGYGTPGDGRCVEALLKPAALDQMVGRDAPGALPVLRPLIRALICGGGTASGYVRLAVAHRYRRGLGSVITHGVQKLRSVAERNVSAEVTA